MNNPFAFLLLGLLIGLIPLVVLLLRHSGNAGKLGALNERLASSETRISTLEEQNSALLAVREGLISEKAGLQADLANERRAAQEKLDLLNEAQAKLGDAFKALSADALKSNNQSFLELAKTNLETFQQQAQNDLAAKETAIKNLVDPLTKSLEAVDKKIGEIEKVRDVAYKGLEVHVENMAKSQLQLQAETSNLVKALRAPQVRGRWGEIQLRRVVEMAGMVNRCDFKEQESKNTEDGRLRPDLIVNLPGGKNIVVDAKCPLQGRRRARGWPISSAMPRRWRTTSPSWEPRAIGTNSSPLRNLWYSSCRARPFSAQPWNRTPTSSRPEATRMSSWPLRPR